MTVFTRVRPQKDGFSLLSLSPRIALMYRALKRPGKGGRMDRIQCAYFGFDSEQQAIEFAAYVQTQHKTQVFPRESDRLVECAWEVKVKEFDGLLEFTLKCHAKAQKQLAAA